MKRFLQQITETHLRRRDGSGSEVSAARAERGWRRWAQPGWLLVQICPLAGADRSRC